jgi:broad specificity phosphatase PhoE
MKFTAVPNVFIDLSAHAVADASFKATTLPLLGLLDREYGDASIDNETLKPWVRLAQYLSNLNLNASEGTAYKVIFLTRHGFGYHNACMSRVGEEAWNVSVRCCSDGHWLMYDQRHWSHLDDDGEHSLRDAHLHPEGIKQAEELGRVWAAAVADDLVPCPATVYTSPLARALETTRLVFAPTFKLQERELRPVVKEALRERLTDHTCDQRSRRKWIVETYPNYVIEQGFSEEDELWAADKYETDAEHVSRKQAALEDIFEGDKHLFIAITCHDMAIGAILAVLGLARFKVREGSTIAMLVKAET